MSLVETIIDLTNRIKQDIRRFGTNDLSLDNYLIDEYFRLVANNWRSLTTPPVHEYYMALQNIVLNDILLKITVGRVTGNLYNSMMTYNASCTEEDLHYALGIDYGGNGEEEHLRTHTGIGNNTSDLNSKQPLKLSVKNSLIGTACYVTVGSLLEVKDYANLDSAKKYFAKDAETSAYHDSNHVFIHLLDSDTFYIAQNNKEATWYYLDSLTGLKHHRRQVKLWMNTNGILGVKFRG